ncbi:hypothetical protein, partial [Actinomadura sp. KC345]|uniref:hypothetical protein n=1 Tax=Actinomadura sp. KC345 TaxID=2530371 RepID=UPI0014045E42
EGDPARVHGELHSAVLVAADHDAAIEFFTAAGGLEVLFSGELSGEEFERMMGLPAGAGFRMTFLVAPGHPPARLELMTVTGPGVDPQDLSDRPLGLRRLVFACDHPDETRARLLKAGATRLDATTLRGPAGIEIELRPETT